MPGKIKKVPVSSADTLTHILHPCVQVYNVLVTAGGTSSLRLFVCSQDTMEQAKLVRKVLAKVLGERCRGVGGGCWGDDARIALLNRLVATLNSDREMPT